MAEEPNAPSVGAAENEAVVAASPTVPPAKLSEDDIFERIDQPGEVQPETETPSEPVAQEPVVPEEPEAELDLEAIPAEHDDFAKYKPLYKENPELRGIIGRHAEFTEMFPEFAFARELHEAIPDRDSLEQTVTDANEWRGISSELQSNPNDFLSSYAEKNPNGFSKMARDFPRLLEQSDRQMWIAQRTETFQEILDNVAHIANQESNNEVLSALGIVAREMGLRLGDSTNTPRVDPRDAELTRLKTERDERIQSEKKQAYESFATSVDTSFEDKGRAEVNAAVKAALAKAAFEDTGGLITEDLTEKIWTKTIAKLNEQPDFKRQIPAMFQEATRTGKYTESEKNRILDFSMKKLAQLRPAIHREVFDKWTPVFVGANKAKIQAKQTIAAQTKDTSGKGAAPAAQQQAQRTSLRPMRPKSEDEIFASIG